MEKVIKKQKGSATGDHSPFRLQNKFRNIPFLYTVWPSLMMQCKGVFELFQKSSANLCKSIYDIINYSASICLFKSVMCGKEGEKSQIFEYLEN